MINLKWVLFFVKVFEYVMNVLENMDEFRQSLYYVVLLTENDFLTSLF